MMSFRQWISRVLGRSTNEVSRKFEAKSWQVLLNSGAWEPPPRIKCNELLKDPRFWAMHYYLHLGTDEQDASDFVEPYFGITFSAMNDFYAEVVPQNDASLPWPYLEVPICDGYSIQVEYAGVPIHETRYLIHHESWSAPLFLGHESGHFALPVFRWREIMAASRACESVNSPLIILLLRPSALRTEADDAVAMKRELTTAWDSLGVLCPNRTEELVDQLVPEEPWNNRGWLFDDDLGWISQSDYSFRNPKTLMCSFDRERFRKVAEFLNAIHCPDVNGPAQPTA